MGLLLGSLALVMAMLRGSLHAIVLAILLASLFAPLHRRVLGRLPTWPNLSAFLSLALVFLVLLVPAGALLSALVGQGITSIQSGQQWIAEGRLQEAVKRIDLASLMEKPSLRFLRKPLETWLGVSDLKDVDINNSRLADTLANSGQRLLNLLGRCIAPLIAGTGQVLVGFAVMLFVLFFAFRDGQRTIDYVRHLLPLSRTQEDALLDRMRDVSRAVVLGTGVTAVAQGVAAMIAFAIVGIPALFWGTALAVASLVPVVGTAVVWIPAVVYLVLAGKTGSAIFLAVWCVVVVGSLDNVLRPIVMGGRAGMPSLVVFFSVVGGIQLFGPMGIVYGPLVFGVCAVCIYTYELENAHFLRSQAAC
jgi:predicted PurR-regulated permease PerM